MKKVELINTIKFRKMSYFGNVLIIDKYKLISFIIYGKIGEKQVPVQVLHSWLINLLE